jgi:hypothetical protein
VLPTVCNFVLKYLLKGPLYFKKRIYHKNILYT